MLQKRYDLSDEGVANEVIDSRAFLQFCGVDSSNQVPDGDTIGRFRNILVRNHLEERLFNQVVEKLAACGLLLRKGTIVDFLLISAPSSTHNQEKKRDPEAHSAKKGNQWHFGYKEHVEVVYRLRKRGLFALQMCVLCCDFSRDLAMTWFLDALVRCCPKMPKKQKVHQRH